MITPSNELTEDELKHLDNFQKNVDNRIDADDDWYYNDTKYISNSMLKILRSHGPVYLKEYLQGKLRTESDAFTFGSALHCAVLEAEEFDDRYTYFDDTNLILEIGGKRPTATKLYKEELEKFKADNSDKEILSLDDYNKVLLMTEKIWDNQQAKELLTGTDREVIYHNEIDGVKTKIKVDATKHRAYIADLKTMSKTPNHKNMTSAMHNFDYDMAGAFYLDNSMCTSFWFIAIEKSYPYTIGIYELSQDSIDRGRAKYEEALADYKHHFVDKNSDIEKFCYMGQI
jgi:hypothetical protein